VKFRLLASAGVALALAVNACSGAAPAVPTSPPAPTPIAATATAVPASPTPAPTAVPTVAPSPTRVTLPTAAPTNTAAVAQAAASPLEQMATAMTAVKSYRVTVTTASAATGHSTTAAIEVVKPDRLHLKANLGGGKTYEIIAIGQDAYINLGGTWTKSPAPVPTSSIVGGDPQTILNQITTSQKTRTLTRGGTSQVNGAPCQQYTWTPAASVGSNVGGTVCIDLKTSLLDQFKSTDGKTVLIYSDWNAPISIVAPI
jgi:hypothetical protein